MQRKTFAISGTSVIKRNAALLALGSLKLAADVTAVENVESGINEQPEGFYETLKGAMNRAHMAMMLSEQNGQPRDVYLAVENGIWQDDQESAWIDQAVVMALIPSQSLCLWEISAGVEYPAGAVALARSRGFTRTTVGQVLFEMGKVSDPKDPHKDLGPNSRTEILKVAFKSLLSKVLEQ